VHSLGVLRRVELAGALPASPFEVDRLEVVADEALVVAKERLRVAQVRSRAPRDALRLAHGFGAAEQGRPLGRIGERVVAAADLLARGIDRATRRGARRPRR